LGQIIVLIIFLVLAKIIWDSYKGNHINVKNKSKSKSGEVIDITDAWIDLNNMPYRKKEYLLVGRELAAYQNLIELLADTPYSVFPKIGLSDILSVPTETNNRQEYYHRIKERSVDYVICEGPELKPILLILLEGKPEGKKKQLVDRFTKKAAEAAQINYLNLNLSNLPGTEELLNALENKGLIINKMTNLNPS